LHMLGLKLPTDPRWVNIVESNIDEILTDHAWCEQKAATNCISIIVAHPEITEMVDTILKIAQEELSHFEMVHERIKKRGNVLGKERRDDYVNDLYKFMRRGEGRSLALVDRLLFSAMIEARSCERFRVLSENIKDEDLRTFYRDLMISEANHYTVFLGFARKYGESVDVEKRWQEWLAYEEKIIANYGKKETVHG
jgi:tRNA-(ms[2]io[6]A)-hydroxylase